MKKTILSLVIAAIAVGVTQAAEFTSAGTLIATNVSWAVAPKGSSITFVTASGANAHGQDTTFYDATASALITNALAASVGSNLLAIVTPGDFVALDSILIFDVSAGTYQRSWILSTNSSGLTITNIYTASALSTQTIAPGDIIYKLTSKAVLKSAANAVLTLGTGSGAVYTTPSTGPVVVETGPNVNLLATNSWIIVSGKYN